MLANANPKNKISGSKEKNFDKASVREKIPNWDYEMIELYYIEKEMVICLGDEA